MQNDLIVRRMRLKEEMHKSGVEACILTSGINLFYLTGVVYTGFLYFPSEGEPIHFVKKPNDIPLDNVVPVRKPEVMADELQNRGIRLPESILIETDILSYSSVLRIISTLKAKEIKNASVLMRRLRMIKTPFEIEQTRLNAQIHKKIYEIVPALYRKGMTDIEFQIEIEYQMRKMGSIGVFFSYGENMNIHMGSLLSGDNAGASSPFDFALGGNGITPLLPLGANGSVIEDGHTVMIDMAGNFLPWMTDITRVYSVGQISELAYRAHQVSIEIHQAVADKARSGVACSELYEQAYNMVKKSNLTDYFMGIRQQSKFVGHGVGLEINEPPVLALQSKEVLEAGMIIAVEPKFVIPGTGAVGIENTYLITDNRSENLTIVNEKIVAL